MKISIPAKIAGLFLAISVVAVAIISLFGYSYSSQILKKSALRDVRKDMRGKSELLEKRLKDLAEDVLLLAGTPPVQGIIRATQNKGWDKVGKTSLAEWKSRMAQIFTSMMEHERQYTQARFIGVGDGGREIVRVNQIDGKIEIVRTKGLQQKGRRYYFRKTIALEPGQVYFSDVDYNREYHKIIKPFIPVIRVGTPVFNKSGIIIINVDVRLFTDYLASDRRDQFYFMTNERGEYLVHPDKSKVLAHERGRQARLQDDFGLSAKLYKEIEPDEIKTIKFPRRQRGMALCKINYDKRDPSRFFLLGSVVDYKLLDKDSEILVNKLMTLALLVMLGLTFVSIPAAWWITRPIIQLKFASDRVADGDENVKIDVTGTDEVSDLARSMSAMLAAQKKARDGLTQLTKTLEAKVSERTEELQKSYDSLKQSETRYRNLVESDPDGILVHSDGKIVYANPAAVKILGARRREELLDSQVMSFIPADNREAIIERIGNVVKGGKAEPFEERLVRVDGSLVDVEITGIPFIFRDKPSVQVIIHDITERKKSIEKLRVARDKAEKATAIKDKFISLVSHDLRSPFAAILGTIRLFKGDADACLNVQHKKMIDSVINSGENMTHMIDELLDISRLQTGAITPEPKFVDAYVVCAVAIGSASFLAQEKGIRIENNIAQGSRIYADQTLITEVIKNLVSNAIKFCKREDVITLYTPPRQSTSIAVKDTGPGVNERYLPNIFKSEVKTSSAGTDGERGTGLGLPYCHDIMQAHEGAISVESRPGQGAVFYVTLPYRRPTALIVDDDVSVRMVLEGYMKSMDIHAIESVNGKEALMTLNEKEIHLVISDIQMPEMNGFDLLKEIRSSTRLKDIPVIIVTSDKDKQTREKIFRLGADDFVAKPFVPEDLEPRIKKFIP